MIEIARFTTHHIKSFSRGTNWRLLVPHGSGRSFKNESPQSNTCPLASAAGGGEARCPAFTAERLVRRASLLGGLHAVRFLMIYNNEVNSSRPQFVARTKGVTQIQMQRLPVCKPLCWVFFVVTVTCWNLHDCTKHAHHLMNISHICHTHDEHRSFFISSPTGEVKTGETRGTNLFNFFYLTMHARHDPIHIEEYRFVFASKYSLLWFHIIISLYLSLSHLYRSSLYTLSGRTACIWRTLNKVWPAGG